MIKLYKEGHIGLSFLLSSPFILLFRILGIDVTQVLITSVLMVSLSSIPDWDIEWEKTKHRGITHTFLAGIVVGIVFAVLIGYAYGTVGWVMGFLSGFGGIASHLLGDTFTPYGVKPLAPFLDRKVAFKFFKSKSSTANRAMLVLGIISFVLCYQPSIVWQIINSMGR